MKHKTHKGMSKRVRTSGTGKFMRRRSHRSHYKLAKSSGTWARLKEMLKLLKATAKKLESC